ncbi:MAG: TolC family protein [Gemmatimonadetes bacterium]|nr:TolC family protein [Gemmatimonadota bacterium]
MAIPRKWRTAQKVIVAILFTAPSLWAQTRPPRLDVGRPVTLDEILEFVKQGNQRLHAARSLAEATSTKESAAGLLPDPTFQIGVMNLGLPDFSSSMPASMAPAIQLRQVFPFPGKLSLQSEIAEQTTSMAWAAAAELGWDVRTKAATAFYRLYATDHQLEVLRSTKALLEQFETVAKAMYAAGTGRQADVLRATVEVAGIDADITRMESTRVGVAARLNALLDRPAETPIGSPVLGPMPSILPAPEVLTAWAEESRPLLDRSRVDVERAESRVALAGKQVWPNLGLGIQYGQRRTPAGTQHMGGIMLGFSLPIFAGSRQLPLRAEADAMRQVALAELESVRAHVDASVNEILAGLDWSRTLIRLYRSEIVPLARATVESSLSSYRVGTVDFMTLVDAQMAVNRFEAELYVFLSQYGTALAELEQSIGRTLPLGEALLAEVP